MRKRSRTFANTDNHAPYRVRSPRAELFDPDDATFAELRPQLCRARAFAAVQTNDINTMKRALKKLLAPGKCSVRWSCNGGN